MVYRWFMMVFDGLWWFMMVYGCVWHQFPRIQDDRLTMADLHCEWLQLHESWREVLAIHGNRPIDATQWLQLCKNHRFMAFVSSCRNSCIRNLQNLHELHVHPLIHSTVLEVYDKSAPLLHHLARLNFSP